MLRFWWLLGTHDAEYYDYRLFDPAIALDDKLAFLSSHRWLRRQRAFNPRRAIGQVNDKTRFDALMRAHGWPSPEQVGQVHVAGLGVDQIAVQLFRLLDRVPSAGIVVKPARGTDSGRGVLVFDAMTPEGELRHVSGEVWGLRAVATALLAGVESRSGRRKPVASFRVERRLVAHPSLLELCPTTFSTCRIVTLLDGGAVHVLGASFKVGVGTLGIDNYARGTVDAADRGSLAVFVDLDTGELGQGYREFDDTVYEAHPHTGVRFRGLRLPYWDEALACVRGAAPLFPELLTLGWDVGFTDEGPVILEANPHWAEDLIQRPSQRGLWRPPLSTVYEGLVEGLEA
jgi:hypothetical protein